MEQLAMAILESIFHSPEGISAICDVNDHLLPRFFKISGDLVSILTEVHGYSPRLLFLIVRVYNLLCQNKRALDMLKAFLPREFQDSTFDDLKKDYPMFNFLLHQLLLYTGKATYHIPRIPPSRRRTNSAHSQLAMWAVQVTLSAARLAVSQWDHLNREASIRLNDISFNCASG
ncbi:hypothetical protein R1flu_018210 [Riccia fluitans]|uniref:Uncharacterized protein n=1 Tax=Riccia fluitans TaxID=41844 RepID=A0ABD1ZFD7_9MARC